ncbi:hypothetical protein BJX99DRAFT_231801 [Aspergillus californicus]
MKPLLYKVLVKPSWTCVLRKTIQIVLHDRETGRSRGYGFVTFGDENEARSAIERLNGHEYQVLESARICYTGLPHVDFIGLIAAKLESA